MIFFLNFMRNFDPSWGRFNLSTESEEEARNNCKWSWPSKCSHEHLTTVIAPKGIQDLLEQLEA